MPFSLFVNLVFLVLVPPRVPGPGHEAFIPIKFVTLMVSQHRRHKDPRWAVLQVSEIGGAAGGQAEEEALLSLSEGQSHQSRRVSRSLIPLEAAQLQEFRFSK